MVVVEAPRGLEIDEFGVQLCVCLAEDIVPCLGLVQHLLQILDSLIFPLAVSPLRGTVLCSATLYAG